MEITRENFREQLPSIIADINRSRFVSFDQEFTGLSSEQIRNPYATLDEVYSNKLRTANGFVVIQVGLTCFYLDDPNGVSYRSYNFYVCPRKRHTVFQCEGEAMSFLARNNFDFNKLFRDGISYCTIPEEERLREQLRERQAKRAEVMSSGVPETGNHILVPEKEEELVQRICDSIDDFLTNPEEASKEELPLEGLNGFQRRLIYQTLESKFFQKVTAATVNNVMVVKRTSTPEDMKVIEEERCKKEESDLEDQIGITLLMKALSESKKLLVGHNIYQDLFYLIRQFFQPLPEEYPAFKNLVHSIFPNILDTKFLCTHDQLSPLINSSVLCDVLRDVRKEEFCLPNFLPAGEEFGYSLDDDKAHEAGYDSLICGVCFIGMAKQIGVPLGDTFEKSPILRPFLNRVFVMGVMDLKAMHLSGKDPAPHRDHVFHITFPVTWKRIDITNRFKDFGGCQVYRLSDTTAFVGLIQRDFGASVWKALQSSPDIVLKRYMEFAKHTGVPSVPGQDSPLTAAVKRKVMDSPVGDANTSATPVGGKKLKKEENAKAKGQFATDDNWTN